MTSADREFAQHAQDFGGLLMGFDFSGCGQNLVQDRRTVAVRVELEERTLREKNPDGMSGSSISVRRVGRLRLSLEWAAPPA
jgi:hypothetical protein